MPKVRTRIQKEQEYQRSILGRISLYWSKSSIGSEELREKTSSILTVSTKEDVMKLRHIDSVSKCFGFIAIRDVLLNHFIFSPVFGKQLHPNDQNESHWWQQRKVLSPKHIIICVRWILAEKGTGGQQVRGDLDISEGFNLLHLTSQDIKIIQRLDGTVTKLGGKQEKRRGLKYVGGNECVKLTRKFKQLAILLMIARCLFKQDFFYFTKNLQYALFPERGWGGDTSYAFNTIWLLIFPNGIFFTSISNCFISSASISLSC